MANLARFLILAGFMLVISGFIVLFLDKLPFLPGHLPGDIFFKKGRFTLFAPITTMLIISVILTLLINFILRFFK